MKTSKTWNCALVTGSNAHGCAAAIASNDPAEYPKDGYGVELSTYSCDYGVPTDIAGALLDSLMRSAVEDGVASVLVFSDVALYPEAFHTERVHGCTLDVVYLDGGTDSGDGNPYDPRTIRRNMAADAVRKELDKLEANAGLITFDRLPDKA